ncbi:protein angel homolog 1 isoform X2 [Pectinophora gossypiella]|nr:protein angel homolog 1 isoform X2 [Pectinophora gossypiella]XP_049885054.1 protein angel homolog 1 isoform X2 [Pectinophora gossypiella]XP_049885055.1 protein angel homolog 1 isoform X2 [Pectinophora gossypiella]XP_049885056.1 protein angel homolog 1 isoform X2 [Pectinophora gossypiella]XP_049885057.1 protein angel homolog 1 isoform X2 [Pectinophora gossypiella]
MSESLQPTLNHVSYGGQFEITSEGSSPGRWKKPLGDSGSTANKKEPCPIPPNFRVWEQILKKPDASDGNSFKFKILSYNVLAQYLLECHPYLYTDCVPHNLTWKVRAARLYDEIVKLAPDILCLQEVQASHLNSFYSKFEKIGYYGVFKQKTGHRHDGCAIYFKQSLFDLWDQVTVEYYQPALPILNRDNIGVMVKLMPRNYYGPPIVIATTHLLYNPQRTDVRLAQIQLLLAELDRFAFYNDGRETGHLPIILTGDFNSTPDSAVIKLLDRGRVSTRPFRDTSDWKNIGVTDNCQHLSVYLNRQQGRVTDFCMTKIHNTDYRESTPGPSDLCRVSPNHNAYSELFNSGLVSHSLNLKSTYNKYKPDGCQEATTFQDFWITVDYIYFSYCSTLKLVERLRLPTADECDTLGKLPNDAYGSDHLALAAVFELKSRKSSL